MSIIVKINTESQFRDEFRACNRQDQFSYDGFKALFNHIEEISNDTGEDYELDVIALCCDFNEVTKEEIIHTYSHAADSEEFDEILEYIHNNTQVIEVNSETFIIQAF